MDVSCPMRHFAVRPGVGEIFRGLQSLATIAITGSSSDGVSAHDVLDVTDRGAYFALNQYVNPGSPIGLSWVASIASVGSSGAGYNVHGIYGMGAHAVVSMGLDIPEATAYRDSTTWIGVRESANVSAGNSWETRRYGCNYDCVTWPFSYYAGY